MSSMDGKALKNTSIIALTMLIAPAPLVAQEGPIEQTAVWEASDWDTARANLVARARNCSAGDTW